MGWRCCPPAFDASGLGCRPSVNALLGQQGLDLLLGQPLALYELFKGGGYLFRSYETRRGVRLTGLLGNSLTSFWRHYNQTRILILQKRSFPTNDAKLMMPDFGSKGICDG